MGSPEASAVRAVKPTASFRVKHLRLDQGKIDFAKRYFGVDSESAAIDRALELLMEEVRTVGRARLRALRGFLRGDRRSWPYA